MPRAPTHNVTVALSPEHQIRLKVLAARLGMKSWTKTIEKLIDMETEKPHESQDVVG